MFSKKFLLISDSQAKNYVKKEIFNNELLNAIMSRLTMTIVANLFKRILHIYEKNYYYKDRKRKIVKRSIVIAHFLWNYLE